MITRGKGTHTLPCLPWTITEREVTVILKVDPVTNEVQNLGLELKEFEGLDKVYVSGVTKGEAGAISGFNLNDSIVSVDDSVPIKSLGELTEHIQTKQADGNEITINFKVQAAPVMAPIQQQQPYAMGAPVRGPERIEFENSDLCPDLSLHYEKELCAGIDSLNVVKPDCAEIELEIETFDCECPEGYSRLQAAVAPTKYADILVKWPRDEGGWSKGKILQEVGKDINGQRHWNVRYEANNIQIIEKLSRDNYSGAPDAPFKSWVMLRKHGRSSRSRSSF